MASPAIKKDNTPTNVVHLFPQIPFEVIPGFTIYQAAPNGLVSIDATVPYAVVEIMIATLAALAIAARPDEP